MPKVIVVAGRDRRTPEGKPANQFEWVGIWEAAETANQQRKQSELVTEITEDSLKFFNVQFFFVLSMVGYM